MTSTKRVPVHQEQDEDKSVEDKSIGQRMDPDNLFKNTALLLPGQPFLHCLISFSITALCGLIIHHADHRVFILGLCAYGFAWLALMASIISESLFYLGSGTLLNGPLLVALLYFLLPLPEGAPHPFVCMLVSLAAFALALPDFAAGVRLLEDVVQKVLLGILTALEKTSYSEWARKTRKRVYEINQQSRKKHQKFF